MHACRLSIHFTQIQAVFHVGLAREGLGGEGAWKREVKGGNEKGLGCKRDGVDLHSNNMKSRFNYISAWGIWVWTDWCFKFKNFWELHLFITNYLRTDERRFTIYIYVHKSFLLLQNLRVNRKLYLTLNFRLPVSLHFIFIFA